MRLFKKDPALEAAQDRYEGLVAQVVSAGTGAASLLPELRRAASEADMSERKRIQLSDRAFRELAETVLDDEILTVDEEEYLLDVAEALGVTQADMQSRYSPVMKQLVLARANDGRLPVLDAAHLMAQRGELVHAELPAALTKQVALKEYRGSSSGLSFRVAKGVRFNTGSARGRMVVVGTQMQTVDTGVLSITSQRLVFSGASKTVESKYAKLVGLEVFTDAISVSVSNRQNNSLFRVEDGPFTAALINAAAPQSL